MNGHDQIQANYESLEAIAARFKRSAAENAQLTTHVRGRVEQLHGGGWQGQGADAFVAEMNQDVLPAMRRLAQALAEAHTTVQRIVTTLRTAEEEAARLFRADERAAKLDRQFETFQMPPTETMTMYPDDWRQHIPGVDQHSVTETEKRMLDDLSLLEQKTVKDIRSEAYETATEFSGGDGDEDGVGDAFRHAYASALLSREFGETWAKDFTTGHEGVPTNPRTKAFMDLHNNDVGIRIARENPNLSKQELANKIAQAVRNGEMVIIDGERQRPVYSDQNSKVKNLPNPTVGS